MNTAPLLLMLLNMNQTNQGLLTFDLLNPKYRL